MMGKKTVHEKAAAVIILAILAGVLFVFLNYEMFSKSQNVSKPKANVVQTASEEIKPSAVADVNAVDASCDIVRSTIVPGFISEIGESALRVTQNMGEKEIVYTILLDESTTYEIVTTDASYKKLSTEAMKLSALKVSDNVVAVVKPTEDETVLKGVIIRKINLIE